MKMTEELIKSVKEYKNGDAEAFNSIYEQSYAYLHTCVIHIVKDEDVAQDMIQETYMEIIKNIGSLEKEESFLSWAAMIANRKCFARIKKNQELLVSDSEEEQSDYFENIADDEAFIPENILDNQVKVEIIKGIIDDLSDVQRACVIGFYYNEQKQDEIADELGIPVNTVKSHLNRAKAKIKESVGETEKKQGIKLYSIAPFMLLLFTKEVKACELVPMSEALTSTAGIGMASVIGKGGMSVSKGIIARGLAKWKIATIVGSVAVAGTVGTIAYISQNNKTDAPVQVEEAVKEVVEEPEIEEVSIPEVVEETLPETFVDKYGIVFSDSNNFSSKYGIVPYVRDENDNKVRQDIPGVELWADEDFNINIDECTIVKSEKDGYVDVTIEASYQYVIGFTKDVSQVDKFSFYVVSPGMYLADSNTGIMFPAQGPYGEDVDSSYTLSYEDNKYDISYSIRNEEDGIWGDKNYTSDNVYNSNLTGIGTKYINATIPADYKGLMLIISKDESVVTDEEWNDYHNFDVEEYFANAKEEYLDDCVNDYYYIKIPDISSCAEAEEAGDVSVNDEWNGYDNVIVEDVVDRSYTHEQVQNDGIDWGKAKLYPAGTRFASHEVEVFRRSYHVEYGDGASVFSSRADFSFVLGADMLGEGFDEADYHFSADKLNSMNYYVVVTYEEGEYNVHIKPEG
ncbi:MAG: sigma-70 family RNA polymerase sigma factor [Lachnospiraceae bacterium]|nr:sigma-70 family RNA polymerase sigma factor [Lachnospiraceae bacterium]